MASYPKIRIAICQAIIPHYRVSLFKLLGAQPGIELSVFTGENSEIRHFADGDREFRRIAANIAYYRLGPIEFRFQTKQLEIVRSSRFDVVILPWDTRYLSLAPALYLAKNNGVPIVLWGHGYSKRPGRFRDWLRNWLGKRASAVLLYSRTIADSLIKEKKFEENRVFIVQNAIDQEPIQEARRYWAADYHQLDDFQKIHGLNSDQTIIFVSRLMQKNKIEILLFGLKRILNAKPEAKLIIIGDGSYGPRLRELADELGLKNHIIFTGPIYDEVKLAPWMLSATLFCYPVNMGLSILHAFGYGLAVVTSNDIASHGPEIEALIPGETGLLYADGDIDDMVRQWLAIIDDKQLRERLSSGAKKQVRESYSLLRMVQGFLDLTRIVDGQERVVQGLNSIMV